MSETSLGTSLPSNEEVLTLYKETQSVEHLQQKLIDKFPKCNWNECDKFVLNTKITRLQNKKSKLSKSKKNDELNSLMKATFQIPEKKHSETDSQIINPVISENCALKRDIKCVNETNDNLHIEVLHAERRIEILENLLEITNEKYKHAYMYKQNTVHMNEELQAWETKYNVLSKKFDTAVEDLHDKKIKLQQSTRNLNKKIKRRDETIQTCSDNLKERECVLLENDSEMSNLKDSNERISDEVVGLKKQKKNLLLKVSRLKMRKNNNCFEENIKLIDTLKLEIAEKDEKLKLLEQTNTLLSDPIIDTFFEGKYTDEIRATIMTLVTECGVSQKKVNVVMETVVKNVTGKTLSRLPSTGVKNRLILEARRVANKQLADTLTDTGKSFTLHQDGTSKFHKHYQSYQLTDSDGQALSAGLVEVSRADASTLFDSFTTLLQDLTETVKTGNQETKMAHLVHSIIATMSDQGSVNPVFNSKFQEFRAGLLPLVYERWDHMNEAERHSLGTVFSFFCKMHVFVNMALEVDKSLSEFEKTIIAEGQNPYAFCTSESGAARLVRSASKALTMHGCDKSGVGGHFGTYLQDKGIDNKLLTFRGHRFNHLFLAAGGTYHHLDDIKDFLNNWADPNDLLRSVLFDASQSVYSAGIKALGIIDKVVTGPLWRLIETVPCSLSLNTHLHHLAKKLEVWSKDASLVLSGECAFSEDIAKVNKDCVYESLVVPSDDPTLELYTQMALEICFGSMLLILERQAKDQLPGGRYWELDPEIQASLSAVPTTNTISERDFAQLDMLMRAKPSANTTTYESIIMWTNNKTSSWLSSLPEDERRYVLDEARTSAPSLKAKMKERKQILFKKKLENLQMRQDKKAKQNEKQHNNKVRLTEKLMACGGLWTSHDQLTQFCASCTDDSDLKDAVVTQLQFRKLVIGSKGPTYLYQQQHKGKVYLLPQLLDNLREIISLNLGENTNETTERALKYKNQDEMKGQIINLKKSLGQKIEENRKKIMVSQQKDLLPKFVADPNMMTGKRIKHKCRDAETRAVEWFPGVVTSVYKCHENTIKYEYNVLYEDDDDEWHFPLLKDMQNGDLIVL